jgi:serine/threonine-protein kinase
MMVPFDQNSMKVTGAPTALIEGMRLGTFGATDLAVSSTGTIYYALGEGPREQSELLWFTRDGKASPVDPDWLGRFEEPALSPDGKQLAISRSPDGLTGDIWIKQLDRGPTIRLTHDRRFNMDPTWTADGRSVTFDGTSPEGPMELWTQRADGSAEAVRQLPQRRRAWGARWAPDGKWLIFYSESDSTGGDIFGIRPGIDSVPVPLVSGKFFEVMPEISPDGHWMAYQSDETGMYQIYVVPFPDTRAAKWAVTTKGGIHTRWSHSGKELFFRDFSGDMFVLPIKTAPTFSSGTPKRLFAAKRSSFPLVGYVVSADDQRLLMIRQLPAGQPDKLIVVENWFEELKGKSRK